MPGSLVNWPDWPEFSEETGEKADDLVLYKRAIVSEYGEESLRKSWLRVCKELERVTDDLARRGTSAIPEVQYDELCTLSEDRKQQLRDVGCFVVRGVVSQEQADHWFADLKDYVTKNRTKITGWPVDTPFVLNIYFSPTQMAARSHPNQLRVQRELNSLWHDSSATTSPAPLSYADAVRIRPPNIPFLGLGPHIDAGSLSRWVDSTYRRAYDAVWRGEPEQLDLYDLSIRKDAKQAFFLGAAHSRMLRAFQGWTALTSAGPGDGSLMLYPCVSWAIAYLLLRPFFRPPPNSNEIMDASQWIFDPTVPWFPGTWRNHSQQLSPSSHPHLRLRECMVNVPYMNAGDTVWWHTDMCHAVEVEHNGDHDSSVAYIAASPTTTENAKYIKGQLKDFLEGRAPEDFRSERKKMAVEKEFVGYLGEDGIQSNEGRRAMGIDN